MVVLDATYLADALEKIPALRKRSCLMTSRSTDHIIYSLDWSSGEGNGTPLQYSCMETPMDRATWWAAVHGVAKSWTQLSNFTFTFHFIALEKEMATRSSVLAWRIPGAGEPGGLPSLGSHGVRHDWSDLAAAAAAADRSSGGVKGAFTK